MIAHYATGGEIDSFYNPEAYGLGIEMADHSITADYFTFLGRLGAQPIDSTTLTLKSNLTAEDEVTIADKIRESAADRIVLTSDSSSYDLAHLLSRDPVNLGARPDQRIVLVGSRQPLQGYEISPAGFNLGAATAALQSERPDLPKVMRSTLGRVSNDIGNFQSGDVLAFDHSYDVLGPDKFLLVPAGGSIDFVPNGEDGLEPASESAIPWYLKRVVDTQKRFEAAPAIMKDSRSLTAEDQDTIVDTIKASTIGHALITVGLVRAKEVGEKIASALVGNDRERTVVLTGSNYILRMAGFTDAPYSLGYGYAQMGLLEPGVYRTHLDRTEDCLQPTP